MDILEKLSKITDLPTIPTSLVRILQIVRNPNAEFMDLVNAMETDQALVAKVLQVANSPLYGYRREVKDLDRAIALIGFNEVRNLAMGLTAFQTLHRRGGSVRFDRQLFWTHCYTTAFVARFIAKPLGFQGQDFAFVGGLLHDIGKVVLDSYFPNEFVEVIEALEQPPHTFYASEHRTLGNTHDEIGAYLLTQWDFPEDLIAAVIGHHTPDRADHPLADLIFTANLIVHQMGVHSTLAEQVISLDTLKEEKDFLGVQNRANIEDDAFVATLESLIENVEVIGDQVSAMIP
jgi:putative nucleotidyltransferase with HDIG domain